MFCRSWNHATCCVQPRPADIGEYWPKTTFFGERNVEKQGCQMFWKRSTFDERKCRRQVSVIQRGRWVVIKSDFTFLGQIPRIWTLRNAGSSQKTNMSTLGCDMQPFLDLCQVAERCPVFQIPFESREGVIIECPLNWQYFYGIDRPLL